MAEGGDTSGWPEWLGHVVTYFSAVGTGFIGGRVKDLVGDINKALADIDEATTLAEQQLRLHALGKEDHDALAKVFTARSNLGTLIDRQFGRRHATILSALSLFSSTLDVCDPSSSSGHPVGQPADVVINNLRAAQQGLRTAICSTGKGRLAKFIGRKSVAD